MMVAQKPECFVESFVEAKVYLLICQMQQKLFLLLTVIYTLLCPQYKKGPCTFNSCHVTSLKLWVTAFMPFLIEGSMLSYEITSC